MWNIETHMLSELSEGTPTAAIAQQMIPGELRYARLELANMFTSLVALYARAFATRWFRFKRVSDIIKPAGTPIEECQRLMAEVYISHWIMDLYTTVGDSVNKLSPFAYTEFFMTEVRSHSISDVYDVFLVHLNSVIRPTRITGCYEDSLFIPQFAADNIDMSSNNPFNIQRFTLNSLHLDMIIYATKDKKVSWRTATLTNQAVGQPVWLFDWHTDTRVCSWFPKSGNYAVEDVSCAYVVEVACTPKLAPQDMDDWQSIPTNMTTDCIDLTRVPRVCPRRYFGGYEVDTYVIRKEKFYVDPHATTRGVKRARISRDESQTKGEWHDTMMEIIQHTFIQLTTFIYYALVILVINDDLRLKTLLLLLEDRQIHSIC